MKIPKVETLIIFAFFGIVALWAVSRCSSKRSDLAQRLKDREEEREDLPGRRDSAKIAKTPKPVVPTPAPASQPQQQVPVTTDHPTQTTAPAATATPLTTTPAPGPAPNVKAPSKMPPAQVAAPPQTSNSGPKYSTLYVTIDGLKVRKEPNLKGEVVTKLKLYDAVFFLNQKTEKAEEISLGYEKVTDHWVKIRTQSGKEGWVFGAGVHYYKMKRKGVL